MCQHQVIVPNKAYDRERVWNKNATRYMMVSCGVCPECLANKANQKAFQLRQQAKISTTPLKWITATYDDAHLPLTSGNLQTLDKENISKFIKRLRSANWRKYLKERENITEREFNMLKKWSPRWAEDIKNAYVPLKFFQSAEYGGKFGRPHHHVYLFDCILSDDEIQDRWNGGTVYFAENPGPGSFTYTTSYMFADKDEKKDPNVHWFNERVTVSLPDVVKPYCTGSKGLGKCWIEDPSNLQYLMSRPDAAYIQDGNMKISVPRAWRKYMEDNFGFCYQYEKKDPFEELNKFWKRFPNLTFYEIVKKFNADIEFNHYRKVKKQRARKQHVAL